jgi:hypothetical protein
MRRGIRLDFERVVTTVHRPTGSSPKPPLSIIAEPAAVLLAHVGGLLAVLAVAGLVCEQCPRRVGGRVRIFEQELGFFMLSSCQRGSVLARAVSVLSHSAGSRSPSR